MSVIMGFGLHLVIPLDKGAPLARSQSLGGGGDLCPADGIAGHFLVVFVVAHVRFLLLQSTRGTQLL